MAKKFYLNEVLEATDAAHNAIKTALVTFTATHPNSALVFATDYHNKLDIIAQEMAKNMLACKTK